MVFISTPPKVYVTFLFVVTSSESFARDFDHDILNVMKLKWIAVGIVHVRVLLICSFCDVYFCDASLVFDYAILNDPFSLFFYRFTHKEYLILTNQSPISGRNRFKYTKFNHFLADFRFFYSNTNLFFIIERCEMYDGSAHTSQCRDNKWRNFLLTALATRNDFGFRQLVALKFDTDIWNLCTFASKYH